MKENKIHYTNNNQKKSGNVVCISGKVAKNIDIGRGERHYQLIK